eukprot:TRINITY_DN7669_c0_g2_i1.p1 TRINITY_DN7669_c0_g2~~TRINITY_DN7669_c0_g2_i1.p1  ORF type:complete len:154 (+),score=17.76 TRINITY_DN7669_c0_g2_i1:74-535(+)
MAFAYRFCLVASFMCAQGVRVAVNETVLGDYEEIGVPTTEGVQTVCKTRCGAACARCKVAFCTNRGFRVKGSDGFWYTFAHNSLASRSECDDVGISDCWVKTPEEEYPQTNIIDCNDSGGHGSCTCDTSQIEIEHELTGTCGRLLEATTTGFP